MTKDQVPATTYIRRKKLATSMVRHNNKTKELPAKAIEIDQSQTIGPRLIRAVSSSENTLFLSLLAFRLVNSFLIQTSFVPDEHWQSVEVAHRITFGYGYLTWEWKHAIRSPVYPMAFALIYKILAIMGLDSRLMIVKLPLLMMGCLAAVADLSLYRFSHRQAGQAVAQYALLSQLMNWFTIFSASRTLINSLEWALTLIALSHFPSLKDNLQPTVTRAKDEYRFIGLVAICILLRPTAVVQWFPLCLWHLYTGWRDRRIRHQLFIYFIIGIFCLTVSCIIEKHFYGHWNLSQINFIQFNIFADVAKFYGVHLWHWYWTQGWPALLGIQFPIFLYSCYRFRVDISDRLIIFTILWSIYVYSFSAHKEFRFLFPLLPMGLYLCGKVLNSLSAHWRRITIGVIIATHVPLSLYCCLVHQRGSLDLMSAIGREIEKGVNVENATMPKTFLFLTPCHATPFYSHIHFNVSMRFLRCEPNLNGSSSYKEEQNMFYDNPVHWLQTEYRVASLPDRIILYDNLFSDTYVERLLINSWRYVLCGRYFHSHFAERDSKHGKYFLKLCK